MNKNAFTLAEVLVTLGIIGVVSAITLPTLIANHRKLVLQTQFKKMYSDLNNASKQFELNEGLTVYDYSVNSKVARSNITLKAFLKYFNGSSEIEGEMSGPGNLLANLVPKSLNGYTTGHPCDESGVIKDASGRFFTMDNNATSDVKIGPKICVDINGSAKPNKYGYDWFVFVFTYEGYVKPYIGNSYWGITEEEIPIEERSDACSYSGSISACAYYALADESPLDSTKSYWKDFLK